jgi:hypothetical protein
LGVHPPEGGLREGIPLVGGFAVPRDCLCVVFLHAAALGVHPSEVGLRYGVALVGQRTQNTQLRCVVSTLIRSLGVLKWPCHCCAEQRERE